MFPAIDRKTLFVNRAHKSVLPVQGEVKASSETVKPRPDAGVPGAAGCSSRPGRHFVHRLGA
jgi:hypothetical protein